MLFKNVHGSEFFLTKVVYYTFFLLRKACATDKLFMSFDSILSVAVLLLEKRSLTMVDEGSEVKTALFLKYTENCLKKSRITFHIFNQIHFRSIPFHPTIYLFLTALN